MSQNRPISSFIEKNYLHFNAAALVDAAKGYKKHIADGKKNDGDPGGGDEYR